MVSVVVITTNYQHVTTSFAIDEVRCRACSASLTYPQRTPTEHDKTERRQEGLRDRGWHKRQFAPESEPDQAPVNCIRCQRRGIFSEDGTGDVCCVVCSAVLAVTYANGDLRFPPFTPPRPLRCSCCQEFLPQCCFSVNIRAVHREGRNAMCRGCMALRLRVKREQNPEAVRAVDRARQATYQARLAPEEHKANSTGKAAMNAAGRRYRARKSGRGVMKQRPGRQPILVKPVCRVAAVCPLRDYCTTEGKGLA